MSIPIGTNVLERPGDRRRSAVPGSGRAGRSHWQTSCCSSRYRLDKPAIAATFTRLLETDGVTFEHEPTVEEAPYIWNQHACADFADCLLKARAAQLGRTRFVTFDAGAAKLPRGELLACKP